MKKLMAVIAAAAVALTLVGCKFGDDKALNSKAVGTKYNLTVTATNDGSSGKLYQRGWKQLGTKETVQAIETKITIDMSDAAGKAKQGTDEKWSRDDTNGTKNIAVVIGLIFDLHETTVKTADATEAKPAGKYYDFCLIGYQPANKCYYIERYVDIPAKAFSDAVNDGVFSTAETYITSTQTDAYYIPTDANKAKIAKETTGKLPKDDDGVDGADGITIQEITVKITQETKGTYVINLGDKDWEYTPTANPDWTNSDGYRIGGAGYYINCPVGLSAKANFSSNKDKTIGLLADEE